jgi:hypothetical protein
MWRRSCGSNVSYILTGSRARAGSQSWRRRASSRGARHWFWIPLLRPLARPSSGTASTRARRPPSSFSSRIMFATSIYSCVATVPAHSARASSFATTSPKPSWSGSSPTAGFREGSSPPRRSRPQRAAAMAARTACSRFRRRAHRSGWRAARLGVPVPSGAGVACAARAARAPVRARHRLARRAGTHPRGL